MLGSNPSRETGYSDQEFLGFCQFLHENAEVIPRLRRHRFLSHRVYIYGHEYDTTVR
jgi:hypothetical protein